jgi:hypothetical protein
MNEPTFYRDAIYAMMDGRRPTTPSFRCPVYARTATLRASPHRHGLLALGYACGCIETQMDGVEPWPGYEVLLVPPAQ